MSVVVFLIITFCVLIFIHGSKTPRKNVLLNLFQSPK